jgi:hypothetical protein
MSTNDYSEDNDYYTQGFESDGMVSIWIGLTNNQCPLSELDVLQDLCGVGYYDLDSQESNCFDCESASLKDLLNEMSYSTSFINEALEDAQKKGLSYGAWVVIQYDFKYDPAKVERKIASDPVYLGCFKYRVTEE